MMGFPLPGVCLFRKLYKELLQQIIQGLLQDSKTPDQCNTRGPLSKLERTPPQRKINVTSKSPVGDISVVTLIRTDTTLDHSQKAEKVCTQTVPKIKPHSKIVKSGASCNL